MKLSIVFCPKKISCCVVAGVLEVLSGITEEDDLVLDSPMFQNHLKYVGLSFTAGMTSATVYAKQPLNSTFFQEVNEVTNSYDQNPVCLVCFLRRP